MKTFNLLLILFITANCLSQEILRKRAHEHYDRGGKSFVAINTSSNTDIDIYCCCITLFLSALRLCFDYTNNANVSGLFVHY